MPDSIRASNNQTTPSHLVSSGAVRPVSRSGAPKGPLNPKHKASVSRAGKRKPGAHPNRLF